MNRSRERGPGVVLRGKNFNELSMQVEAEKFLDAYNVGRLRGSYKLTTY